MSPEFSFNLKNDDIEDDASEGDEPVSMADVRESSKAPATEPRLHTLRDMVRSLALPSDRNTYRCPRSTLFDSSSKRSALRIVDPLLL